MKFKVIDGCPVPASVAPYVARILRHAGQSANSIYRGTDAGAILARHGKRTQAELFRDLPPGVANPPGRSTHELRSDGVAYRVPIGRRLAEWQVGVDSGGNSRAEARAIEASARHYGWPVKHPYRSGVEQHHWNFVRRPRPKNPRQLFHLVRERRALPSR